MPEMSRDDAIRRLEAVSKEVHHGLTNGAAFLGKERRALAQSLIRLLPLLAAVDRQGQKDTDPRLVVGHAERWDAKSSN
jgi:hypothetical protein